MLNKSYYKNMPAKNTLNDYNNNTYTNGYLNSLQDIPLENMIINSNLENEKEIVIRVTGNGCLYNMVRIIAGTLIRVGRGFYEPEKIRDILEAKEHTSEGITAPPNGLVLVSIDYPL